MQDALEDEQEECLPEIPKESPPPRAVTVAPKQLKAERAERRHLPQVSPDERPRTRADCVDSIRPCPFVGCRHNLYLDVDHRSGSIKFNFPDREPDEIHPEKSCSLDLADRGGMSLEEVGQVLGVTNEAVRLAEVELFPKVRKATKRVSGSEWIEGGIGAGASENFTRQGMSGRANTNK